MRRKNVDTCLRFATSNTFRKQFFGYLLPNGYVERVSRGIYRITPKRRKALRNSELALFCQAWNLYWKQRETFRMFGPNIRKLLEEERYDDIKKLALIDKRVVPGLIRQLESKSLQIRIRAANILGEMREPRALPTLEKLVEKGVVTNARADKAILRIVYAPEAELLISALTDQEMKVREKVVEALTARIQRWPNEQVIEALVAASKKDKNETVRTKARLALIKAGKYALALKGSNARDRFMLARTLFSLWETRKLKRAIESLVTFGHAHKDTAVVGGAYPFFVSWGKPSTVPLLIKALNEYGHMWGKKMAEDFLNCGNGLLAEEARRWLLARGFQIKSTTSYSGPKWGERKDIMRQSN